ncbi:MAG: MBL fold metallo-hydrolase [Candidatus Bathyarchaeia archaeon]
MFIIVRDRSKYDYKYGMPVEELIKGKNNSLIRLEGIKSFEEALREIELKPIDIDLVILTHLHMDHYFNVFKCINAEILTPSHTSGCQSVMIGTSKGKVIISGYVRENFEPRIAALSAIPPGMSILPIIPPGVHTDVLQAYDSALRIKKLADVIIPFNRR